MLSIGRHFQKVGEKIDEHKKNYSKMNFDYELKKANIEDANTEKLFGLEEDFVKIQTAMRQALHHPRLNETLEKCFAHIDDIEKEYRDYHDFNVSLTKEHPGMIRNLHITFEKTVAEIFELLSQDKKSELEERNLKKATALAEKFIGNKRLLEEHFSSFI